MPLDVVGAGLGRTGTRTLKAVLEHLGFGPCYHMMDLMEDPSRLVHWQDAAAGRDTDWEALFDGYRSVADYFGCQHWRELSTLYPDAKVILTVRPFEGWHKSVYDTIYPSSRGNVPPPPPTTPRQQVTQLAWDTIWAGDFERRFEEVEFARAKWEAHLASVKAGVPEDRLLVYEVSQGWAPLCDFLRVPIPDDDYPRLNTTRAFQAKLEGRHN